MNYVEKKESSMQKNKRHARILSDYFVKDCNENIYNFYLPYQI
jgi:hypothetical protein